MANRKALTPDLKQEVCARIAEGETMTQIGASDTFPLRQQFIGPRAREVMVPGPQPSPESDLGHGVGGYISTWAAARDALISASVQLKGLR